MLQSISRLRFLFLGGPLRLTVMDLSSTGAGTFAFPRLSITKGQEYYQAPKREQQNYESGVIEYQGTHYEEQNQK